MPPGTPRHLYDAYVFDLDGTVLLGETLLPTAGETIGRLRALGKRTLFLTNNSTSSHANYAEALTAMGLPTPPSDVVNSTLVLIDHLATVAPGARLMVIGERPLVNALAAAGFVIVDEPAPLEVAGTTFALNHFPYEWDERHGGKHAPHHPPDEGEWLLHGHVHDLWRQRGRQINVGLDAWGRLLSEEDIAALVAGGERTLMGGQPGPFTDSPLADR